MSVRIWRDGSANRRLLLFGVNTTLGWRIVRTIDPREGERGVEQGKFRRVLEAGAGALLGYQIVSSAEQRGDLDLPSLPSAAAISTHEMEVNAGTAFRDGRSRTAGLSEEKRLERAAARHPRTGEYLTPEDAIERIQAKVAVYRRIGPAAGDILRVLPV